MEKGIIFYLLGLMTVGLFGFTSGITYTQFEPMKPTRVVVTEGSDSWCKWVKEGYQIQTATAGSSGRLHFVLVRYY